MIIASKRPRLVVSPKSRNKFSASHRTAGRRLSVSKRLNNAAAKASANRLLIAANAAVGGSVVDAATQRGNIKVVVRVRPPNDRESATAFRTVVVAVDDKLILFDPKEENNDFYFHGVKQKGNRDMLKKPHKDLKFCFDQVYGPQHTNEDIFGGTILTILDTILNGYNCSVFAYGATGAGKTFTMLGSQENPGLTFLTVMELYRRLSQMNADYEAEVAVSYLEVYNETVRDLLSHSESGPLNIREDAAGVIIPNLSMHKPTDATALLEMLARGNSVRSQHPTDQNSESSRSHAVFQVFITLRGRFTDRTASYKAAKLVMVDLAGSERGAATGFSGARFREGANINRSLLALGNCINALADGKRHIPYRDSKLTRILKDSLGGNCKTVMIANVSPSGMTYDDSYNTLRYADRAKRIRFQVKKNIMSVSACISKYGKVIEEMTAKIESLNNQLMEKELNCRCSCLKTDCGTELGDSFWEAENQSPIELKDVTISVMDTETRGDPIANFNETVTLPHPSTTNEILLEPITTTISHYAPIPIIPYDRLAVDRFIQLLEEKKTHEQDLLKANNDLEEARRRRNWKANRVKLIEAMGTLDLENHKGVEKMKKYLDSWDSKNHFLRERAASSEAKVKQVDEAIKVAQENLSKFVKPGDPFITISLSEFIEYKNSERQLLAQNTTESYLKKTNKETTDEALNANTLLTKCMSLMQPLYKITRHAGHTTTAIENDYNDIMSVICGTKVSWAMSRFSSPSVKSPIQDSSNIYRNENQNYEEY